MNAASNMQFRTLPCDSSRSLSLLLVLAYLHLGLATLGTVNIDELLLSPEQQLLSSQAKRPASKSPYAPWSHKPYCTNSSPSYCVYTSNTTGTSGISIVTTPKLADEIATTLDEDTLSHFLTQEQAEYLYYNPPPYSIEEIPAKGKGVVATRTIKKFETFMVDQASIVVDLEAEEKLSSKDKGDMTRAAVERLRRPEAVRSLARGDAASIDVEMIANEEGSRDEKAKEQSWEEDIMRTNAFGTTVAGEGFSGLFPLVSRINHACNPNAFILFSQAGVAVAIKAYRTIEPNEEITISYLPFGLPAPDRHAGLKRWSFECTCSLCSLSGASALESDTRRTAIATTGSHIQSLLAQHKINAAIQLAEQILQHMKDEDLQSMLPDQYTNLVRMNLAAGDREAAEGYAEEALELLGGMGFLGTDWEGEWGLERLLEVVGGQGIFA